MGYLFFWPNGVDAGGTWTLRHFHFIIRLGLFWSREALRTRNLNVEEMKLYLAMQSFLSQASWSYICMLLQHGQTSSLRRLLRRTLIRYAGESRILVISNLFGGCAEVSPVRVSSFVMGIWCIRCVSDRCHILCDGCVSTSWHLSSSTYFPQSWYLLLRIILVNLVGCCGYGWTSLGDLRVVGSILILILMIMENHKPST